MPDKKFVVVRWSDGRHEAYHIDWLPKLQTYALKFEEVSRYGTAAEALMQATKLNDKS